MPDNTEWQHIGGGSGDGNDGDNQRQEKLLRKLILFYANSQLTNWTKVGN